MVHLAQALLKSPPRQHASHGPAVLLTASKVTLGRYFPFNSISHDLDPCFV
jgi:hypothetical protein